MKPNNPFQTVGYFGPDYFCDRRKETKRLLDAVENDSNVTLIAPRRYGKTGLIHHFFHNLPADAIPVYLDIYSIRDLAGFSKAFASAVIAAGDSVLDKTLSAVGTFFKNCRPTITPQADGLPKFSFDIAPSEAEASLRDAFEYLKHREKRLVIAIDEFQQVCEFPEQGTEALLRTLIQEVPWVRFIFAGSRHHLMGEMFLTAKHPFYNSTDVLSLKPIDKDVYGEFAAAFFSSKGRPFSIEAFGEIYDRFSGITWYVQRVLKEVWAQDTGLVDRKQIDSIISELVADRELTFSDLFESQNGVSQTLLRAIAAERCVEEPTATAFLAKYGLCASSVRSALTDLVARDIVYKSDVGYRVYERLFDEWLRKCL